MNGIFTRQEARYVCYKERKEKIGQYPVAFAPATFLQPARTS
jgi:hypothetical protein